MAMIGLMALGKIAGEMCKLGAKTKSGNEKTKKTFNENPKNQKTETPDNHHPQQAHQITDHG